MFDDREKVLLPRECLGSFPNEECHPERPWMSHLILWSWFRGVARVVLSLLSCSVSPSLVLKLKWGYLCIL